MLSYQNYLPLQHLILLVKRSSKDGATISPPADVPAIVLEWGLGAGETAVIAAALESQEHTAVLDDA